MASLVLVRAAGIGDFIAARSQMGFSLGWHIIIACFGVGFPRWCCSRAAFASSSVLTPFFLGTVAGGIAFGRVPPGLAREPCWLAGRIPLRC